MRAGGNPDPYEYMIDHGVGVTDYKTYTVKKLDSDYFEGI